MLPIFNTVQATIIIWALGHITIAVTAEFAAKAGVRGDLVTAVAFYTLSAVGLLLLALAVRTAVLFAVAFVSLWIPAIERAASKSQSRIMYPRGRE